MTFPVPIYNVNMYVSIGQSDKTFRAMVVRSSIDRKAIDYVCSDHCPDTNAAITVQMEGDIFIRFHPEFDILDKDHHSFLAHEIAHAVDFIFEYIGEEKPGKEARGYLTQFITEKIFSLILL